MIRPTLTLILVALQCFSWSAAPLYLCVSRDGTVCIDLGPETCRDCRHSTSQVESPSHDEACCAVSHDRDGAEDQPSEIMACGDCECDCMHFQLFGNQSPTIVGAAAQRDNSPDEGRFLQQFDLTLGNSSVCPRDSSFAGFGHRRSSPILPLSSTVLKPVVLRC